MYIDLGSKNTVYILVCVKYFLRTALYPVATGQGCAEPTHHASLPHSLNQSLNLSLSASHGTQEI